MNLQVKGWVVPATVGIASFVAGIGAGYTLRKIKEKKNFETKLEDLESQIVQLHYEFEERSGKIQRDLQITAKTMKTFSTDGEDLLERFGRVHLDEIVVEHHPSNNQKTTTLEVVSNVEDNHPVNVFRNDDEDDWDYEEELKHRSPEHPYIIHRDEYFSDEMDFSQSTLSFYAGDQILCDEEDVPIYNPEKVVGKLEFGKGSRDPSIVYIRNEKLQAEYEVLLDPGYYQTEVLGEQVKHNLKHSRGVLKFRPE
ncbi:MAG: hypothetical protein ABWY25_07515 [Paenisporosarcina sp.]